MDQLANAISDASTRRWAISPRYADTALSPPVIGLSSVMGKGAASPERPQITLITQFFLPEDRVRRREVQSALRLNCACPYIVAIQLLNERVYTSEELGLTGEHMKKVTQVVLGRRLKFSDALHTKTETWFTILANVDISFDVTLDALRSADLRRHIACLRRTEVFPDSARAASCFYSQDAWIWCGEAPREVLCDFELCRPGCDKRFVYEVEQAGYIPTALPLVKAYHHHSSPTREYEGKSTERIDGPYRGLIVEGLGGMNVNADVQKLGRMVKQSAPRVRAANLSSIGTSVAYWGRIAGRERVSQAARDEGVRYYIASDNYGAELYARLFIRGLKSANLLLRLPPWASGSNAGTDRLAMEANGCTEVLHSQSALDPADGARRLYIRFGVGDANLDGLIVIAKARVAAGPFIARLDTLWEYVAPLLSEVPPQTCIYLCLGPYNIPLLHFLSNVRAHVVCSSEY